MEELYRLFPTEIAKDGSKAQLLKYAVSGFGLIGWVGGWTGTTVWVCGCVGLKMAYLRLKRLI
jgi:hypothetical protein